MRGGRRLRIALAVAAISVLALSGCATQKAGSAAVAGDERLTEAQLTDLFGELDELYNVNPDAQRLPNDQLTLSVLSWWVNEQLIGTLAREEGLTATQAQIDQVLGADQKQRDAISLGNGIPPSRLDAAAEVFVLSSALTDSLAEPGATKEETDAALMARLQETADDLGISISPRFGTWNSATVSVQPRNPERLSSPAGGVAEPPALDVPGQG
ncbi:MAG: hypothetical protein LH645_00120 [Actinomycetia bacterium]|nr:hypothetical protein [Actinomycetes bacterium]